MRISFNSTAISKTQWHEYALRFLFGGAITVIAGLLARKFGAIVGGLFLAFPAIFPATATLIEKHESQKKKKAGINGGVRGREAAALDASGAATGAIGLAVFGYFVWKTLPIWNAGIVLPTALLIWAAVSISIWRAGKLHSSRKQA
jgi:hypothetical protein